MIAWITKLTNAATKFVESLNKYRFFKESSIDLF
jgi:hypothetical protein